MLENTPIMKSWIENLAARFDVMPLKPFGCRVTCAKNGSRLSDIDSRDLKALLDEYGFVVFREFDRWTSDQFLEASSQLISGHDQHVKWDFGAVMELKQAPRPDNYLFSSERVPYHWDGAFHMEPSYLLFHCLEAPNEGSGGETLFVHSERLFQSISRPEIEQWHDVKLTYRTEKLAHYGGEFTTPLFLRAAGSLKYRIRFAEPVDTELNPVSLTISGLESDLHRPMLERMTTMLYDSNQCYAHKWQSGDYLIADNQALLHGRHAFRFDSPRHIRRIQLR